jgi:hypothetical protein
LIDDDYGIAFELALFAFNNEKEVCIVLEFCFSFWEKRYE